MPDKPGYFRSDPTFLVRQGEGSWNRYLVAILCAVAAILLRLLLSTVTRDEVPFISFFPAVMLSAWYGGTRPALLTALLSLLAVVRPFGPGLAGDPEGRIVAATLFLATSAFAGILNSALKRSAEALAESRRRAEQGEERLQLALKAGQIGVWDWDIAADKLEWSDLLHDIHGLTRGTFDGGLASYLRLIVPEDRRRVETAIQNALSQHLPLEFEYRVIHPDGRLRWIHSNASAFKDEAGRTARMAGASSDVTERKNAEIQMRQQWLTFDTALSNTPDFAYIFDLQGRFTYVNRALLTLLQVSLEDAVGKNFHQLGYPTDLADRLQRQIQQVIDTGQPLRDQTLFTDPSGRTGSYEYIFVPVRAADGRVEAVAGSTRDITERNAIEQALRKSEERLSFALEAGGGVGTWDWDLVADRVYCNAQFARLFSVDPALAEQGAPIAAFVEHVHPDDRERVALSIRNAIESGGEFAEEYRLVSPEGPVRWVYARGRSHLDDNGNPSRFPGVVFDVTARKAAEQALQESEDRLRAVYDGTYEFMGLLSRDGTLLDANRATLRLANNTREEVIGRPFWETPLFTSTPGVPQAVRDAIARASAGEFVRFETAVHRPDGETPVFDISFHPVRNDRGEVVLIVPEGRDITELKRAEQELLRSNTELRRANRELEEFAYVASHDLQEPLRMVNIYAELLVTGAAHPLDENGVRDEKLDRYAGFIRQGVLRMQALIHDLLTFSTSVHSDEIAIGNADLNASLKEALSVLHERIRENGATVMADPLPVVAGDTAQLAHVFQNLISNALKYRREEPPRIRISAVTEEGKCTVVVADNGIGFEQQYAERIFGLFKRLHKDEYPGTGLGLAICRRIVERYGGVIRAEGKPGEGATMYVTLPLSSPSGNAFPPNDRADAKRAG